MPNGPQNIPEERVAAILARAAELDRQTITLDTLRAAALEAGISAVAVDQALAEYAASGVQPTAIAREVARNAPPARSWRYWLKKIVEPLKLGALALAIGILGAADESLATIAVCWLIGMGGYLAWRDRGTGSAVRFQVNALVMSVVMFVGMLGANGDEDALGFVAGFALALLILGTLIIHFAGEGEAQDKVTAG